MKTTKQAVWTNVDDTLPGRDQHDYYGNRYSVPVELTDGENEIIPGHWRYDFQMRGWVDSRWRDGCDPTCYPDANMVLEGADDLYIDHSTELAVEWRAVHK